MSSQEQDVTPTPYPALTRSASGKVSGIQTDVTSIAFADKILITISQGGRLAQWVHVPLDISTDTEERHSSLAFDDDIGPPSDMLPMAHLTATTVLGSANSERETVGQLCATQIASAIATKDATEKRTVVIGLGLEKSSLDKQGFMVILELAFSVI
ncbi:hypothetical protein K402DRAFT_411223 [Aulographum hederae CBS 113979]|uniref:Uncharacterized protein n=1 Tax=Aulographum hederae CBS 113979 TaxID=1176131 RepID=A0A6G1H7K6_9PEZI|nr:hypothetical protein K402DRAFT_411223 [Aulographum hederae CBS 113979]